MDLNADFSERVVVHSAKLDWVASPMPGVDRRMLDRIGDEVARATTIVRYAPESAFSPHVHTGGEEFIVLDGVFQDEHGDFPKGTYVRNPPTTQHTPSSDPGCTIFVKLWQFDPEDRVSVCATLGDTLRKVGAGRQEQVLHVDTRERVSYHVWDTAAETSFSCPGGAEILVLGGEILQDGDVLSEGGWLRLPQDTVAALAAGAQGARFWMKQGHLPFAKAPDV